MINNNGSINFLQSHLVNSYYVIKYSNVSTLALEYKFYSKYFFFERNICQNFEIFAI